VLPSSGSCSAKKGEASGTTWPWTWRCYDHPKLTNKANKKVQLDATVRRHLFTAQSLYMFRVSQHPSSGVLKTVSATSGIGHDTGTATSFHCGLIRTGICHDTGTATSFHRGLIRPRWKEVAVPVSWPIPEVADTVFSTPDDGCCETRNM